MVWKFSGLLIMTWLLPQQFLIQQLTTVLTNDLTPYFPITLNVLCEINSKQEQRRSSNLISTLETQQSIQFLCTYSTTKKHCSTWIWNWVAAAAVMRPSISCQSFTSSSVMYSGRWQNIRNEISPAGTLGSPWEVLTITWWIRTSVLKGKCKVPIFFRK